MFIWCLLLLCDWHLLCDRLWKVLQVTFQWMIIEVDQNVSGLRGRDRVTHNHHNQAKSDMRMMVINVVRRKIKQTASNWDGRWWSEWNVKWWSTENVVQLRAWVLFFYESVHINLCTSNYKPCEQHQWNLKSLKEPLNFPQSVYSLGKCAVRTPTYCSLFSFSNQ